jgi:SAM-dependent methyltransferase
VLKNSLSLRNDQIWGIENVSENRERRLYGILTRFYFGEFLGREFFNISNDVGHVKGRGRDSSETGASDVADWSRMLPSSATVLDLGCGTGVPISQALIERGFNVYGVDASPTMVQAFRARFPTVPIVCAAVEDSDFFGRTFDGVVAWGLFFLLDVEVQRKLIEKIGDVLRSGGRLLFTAPRQSCSWRDILTGRISISLGYEAYRNALEAEGMSLVGTHRDDAENYYYFAQKI